MFLWSYKAGGSDDVLSQTVLPVISKLAKRMMLNNGNLSVETRAQVTDILQSATIRPPSNAGDFNMLSPCDAETLFDRMCEDLGQHVDSDNDKKKTANMSYLAHSFRILRRKLPVGSTEWLAFGRRFDAVLQRVLQHHVTQIAECSFDWSLREHQDFPVVLFHLFIEWTHGLSELNLPISNASRDTVKQLSSEAIAAWPRYIATHGTRTLISDYYSELLAVGALVGLRYTDKLRQHVESVLKREPTSIGAHHSAITALIAVVVYESRCMVMCTDT